MHASYWGPMSAKTFEVVYDKCIIFQTSVLHRQTFLREYTGCSKCNFLGADSLPFSKCFGYSYIGRQWLTPDVSKKDIEYFPEGEISFL